MTRAKLMCSMATVALLMMMAPSVWAGPGKSPTREDLPAPANIARACVKTITAKADRTVQRNERRARDCARRIRRLLADGEDARAELAADRCIRRINRQSNQAIRVIEHRCDKCIGILMRFGAINLARRVDSACMDEVAKIEESTESLIRRLENLLNGDED